MICGAAATGPPASVRFGRGGGAIAEPIVDDPAGEAGVDAGRKVEGVIGVEEGAGVALGADWGIGALVAGGVIEKGLRSDVPGDGSAEGHGVSSSVLGGFHMVGPSLGDGLLTSCTYHSTSER